jgi:hypothetical protein
VSKCQNNRIKPQEEWEIIMKVGCLQLPSFIIPLYLITVIILLFNKDIVKGGRREEERKKSSLESLSGKGKMFDPL